MNVTQRDVVSFLQRLNQQALPRSFVEAIKKIDKFVGQTKR